MLNISRMASVSALAMSIMLASCGGKTSDDPENAAAPDAQDLVIETAPPVETAGTDVEKLHSADGTPLGYDPDVIMGQEAPLLAIGTEPDWTAEIGDGIISFERHGLPLVEVILPEFEDTGSEVSVVSGGLSLTLTPDACDDAERPIGVVVSYEEIETEDASEAIQYVGCAGAADGAHALGAGDSSWKDLIEPSSAAIEACLSETDKDRVILALYPREPGTTGMILGDKYGGYEECGASTDTGDVSFLDPMSADQAEDWMTGAALLPTGSAYPCGQGEAIGSLGTFHPNGCKG